MEIEHRREGDILVAKVLNDRLDARGVLHHVRIHIFPLCLPS